MKHKPKIICEIICDGDDIFVVRDGVKFAKRGHPDTMGVA
jgi:hypothetical protein